MTDGYAQTTTAFIVPTGRIMETDAMSGVAEQKPTNNYSMSTSEKYWQIRRHIRACIAKYEKRIRKIESQKPKNETALGYFDQGRKAAYERVIADMIQYSEKEGQYDEE